MYISHATPAALPLTTTRDPVRSRPLGRMGDLFRLWRVRAQERAAFGELDDRALRDLRISRWDIQQELKKPFWRD